MMLTEALSDMSARKREEALVSQYTKKGFLNLTPEEPTDGPRRLERHLGPAKLSQRRARRRTNTLDRM